MSALVVTDVTSVPVSSAAVAVSGIVGQTSETTITPFKKVLKEAVSAASPETEEVNTLSTKAVSAASSGGGVSGTTKLDNIFRKASEKYDISYDFLVAVAKAESDFDYKCVSSAGAKGIMQLMPDEVKDMNVSDVYNPEENIMAAARLLKAHLKKFDGDYTLAAAAYNAGSGAVKKYGGVPPYTETQNYVKKIAKYMKEGVTVPDKDAEVTGKFGTYDGMAYGATASESLTTSESGSSGTSSGTSSGSSSSAGSESSLDSSTSVEQQTFDYGVYATDDDMADVRVTIGTGDNAVTMTYGAYQKYKEIGSLGVG